MAGAAARCASFCGVGGEFFLEPDCLGRSGISIDGQRRNGCCGRASDGKKREKGAAGGLTEPGKPFNLKEMNRGCPEPGKVLRFVFVDRFECPPRDHETVTHNCWEVVQLAGLQILNLAILVRVQASQPKF